MIIETNIDVLVFPNWLYGLIQGYTRKRSLLSPYRDVENDRIIGTYFLNDPDYTELLDQDFQHASEKKKIPDWVSTKKYKYDDSETP